jgi:uncharacterized RDD family membrane protein YckC
MMSSETPTHAVVAPRWQRLLAILVDAVLVPTLTLILVMLTNVAEDAEDYVDSTWMLHVLLLAVLSYLLLNGYTLWRRGQTLGKCLFGIMVAPASVLTDTASKTRPAPLWVMVLVRAWFFAFLFVAVIPYFAWLPLLDQLFILRKDRRCLHDLICGTVVIKRPSVIGELS